MASLHPADRVSSVRPLVDRGDRAAPKGEIHPSICVFTGFGFIAAVGVAVHLIFRVIF
ncbi:hypothetical protein [Brevundimonas aurifodinae]|uniref:Uncharacterized protein n=1 Tax=Brevundimonas aurifodinae TaxID=1508312 RepID=A0ABV1NM01_9CAUL